MALFLKLSIRISLLNKLIRIDNFRNCGSSFFLRSDNNTINTLLYSHGKFDVKKLWHINVHCKDIKIL